MVLGCCDTNKRLTNLMHSIMIRQQLCKSSEMVPRYDIGQKVVIRPVRSKRLSPRDSDLERYVGQSGEVTDYHWISLERGAKVFYIYTVRIGDGYKEVVLHEDELEAYKS